MTHPAVEGADTPRFIAVGLAGSLRRDSFNGRLLSAAARLAPPGLELRICPLGRIPLYDADLDSTTKPRSVTRLRAAIEAADALIIATPEYNASIPGVLKNALDWASRPAFASPLAGKPVLMIGATPGRGGAARALANLRQVLGSTRSEVLTDELGISTVHERLSGTEIVDPELERQLRTMLQALRDVLAGVSLDERSAS